LEEGIKCLFFEKVHKNKITRDIAKKFKSKATLKIGTPKINFP